MSRSPSWAIPSGRCLGAAPAKKAVQRIKGRIRGILRPGNQAPWAEVQQALNRVRRGWATYVTYGTRLLAYRAVDNYVSQSVRQFLRRRHHVASRGTTRWADTVVFGGLGVLRLRHVHGGRLRMPRCETRPRAVCGNTARTVR